MANDHRIHRKSDMQLIVKQTRTLQLHNKIRKLGNQYGIARHLQQNLRDDAYTIRWFVLIVQADNFATLNSI